MQGVFSILFWAFFGLSCAINFVIALAIWIVTTPFDRERRINHLFSCAWGWLYTVVYPGWDVRVLHRDRIRAGRPYVLVANHTSVADIVLLLALFRQYKWISKKTVFKFPFLGWNMWLCRYVPLVRGDPSSIERMMQRSKAWLERGISILMFPEGTRSEDGVVKPFKHGAFTLARETGASVVPIAIHGGHLLIPKHGKAFATKAKLVVEILDPVSPEGFASADELGEAIRGIIKRALAAPEDAGKERHDPPAHEPFDKASSASHDRARQ